MSVFRFVLDSSIDARAQVPVSTWLSATGLPVLDLFSVEGGIEKEDFRNLALEEGRLWEIGCRVADTHHWVIQI